MRPLSVLIVAPVPSHPPMQGNSARITAFAGELRQRGIKIDFLYYGMEGLSKSQAEVMIDFWDRFVFVKSLPLPHPRFAQTWGIDDWCADTLCETAANLHARHRYDAVIVNYVWMSKVLTGITGALKVIDTHDLFGDRHRISEHHGLDPRWFFTTTREEARGFARADVVIGIQANETKTISSRYSGDVLTIGHPMTPKFLDLPPAAPHFTFGYFGSANEWNVRSVKAVDAALAETPIARWTLAGTICRRALDLKSGPMLMGVIDSPDTFYNAVDCVLNPMLGGTGLKIKTIEAAAYGKPIIGTRDAFEGLAVAHPFHRLQTIPEMISAMRSYAETPGMSRDMALATRILFISYMRDVARGYDALAERIAAFRAQSRPATARSGVAA